MLPHASPAAAAPPDKVPGALVLASAGALLSAGVGHKVLATASQGGAAAGLVQARGAATRGAEPHSVAPGALREGCPNQQLLASLTAGSMPARCGLSARHGLVDLHAIFRMTELAIRPGTCGSLPTWTN